MQDTMKPISGSILAGLVASFVYGAGPQNPNFTILSVVRPVQYFDVKLRCRSLVLP